MASNVLELRSSEPLGQRLEGLHLLGDAGDDAGVGLAHQRAGGGLGRRTCGLDDGFAAVGDRLLDLLQPRRDIDEFRQGRARLGEMLGKSRNLCLETAHEVGIEAGELAGRLVEPVRDAFEAGFQAAYRRLGDGVAAAGIQRRRQFGEARVDHLHQGTAVESRLGLAGVDPFGDLVQPALQFAKQHVALFQRIVLAAFEEARQNVEALLDTGEDLADVGHRRLVVDFVGDDRDLVGEAFDGLVGQGAARRQFVDPASQRLKMLEHFDVGRSSETSSICRASAEILASMRSKGSGSG